MLSAPNFITQRVPGVGPKSIEAVLALAGEGATVPFMARYRKEKTGNLDEVQIRGVLEGFSDFQAIQQRREFVLSELEKQGNLSPELKKALTESWDLGQIEEIYRPFKKKKKSKATIAREAGLGPLADWIWNLSHGTETSETTIEVWAKEFVSAAKGVATYDEAMRGAQHILVERLSNVADLRAKVRAEFLERGVVKSLRTAEFKTHSKFAMYAEFSEPIKLLGSQKASHRYLALRRGWQEGELKVTIEADEASLLHMFEMAAAPQEGQARDFMKVAAKIALDVHVIPSITNEIHAQLKERADLDAIQVFAENVRRVLMGSPFGPKVVLGVDPGLRTGCKVALVDKGGNFISNTVLQIQGEAAREQAKQLFSEVIGKIKIESIAVGNGTGGREAETFIRATLKEIGATIPVIMVSESGASVYSASDVAREEFPQLDLTVRGAISIARRVQDPLAELVKIEPKSIGVGQYQHDVSQSRLKKSLGEVVESCVNQVGVDLNTASTSLLQYVSGIGPAIARNIVQYRTQVGLFKERNELMQVPQFSGKVFEQAAGFLRIADGKTVLDRTGVHPERYGAVREMAGEIGATIPLVMGAGSEKLKALRPKWSALIGEYTFDDILRELEKPGRDPRDVFKPFSYRDDIFELKDLKAGMICPGIVTNVTNFGAFVDIGVHQDGLVHISEISHQFVDDPRKVVASGDTVQVKVLAVDLDRGQISLTMKMEERPLVQAPVKTSPARVAKASGPQTTGPARKAIKKGGDKPAAAPTGPSRISRPGAPPAPGARMPANARPPENRGGDRRPAGSPFNNPFAALLKNGK